MPIPRSLRARAKQTRLAFSPLASSSPARSLLPTPDIKQEALPTPEPSSQIERHTARPSSDYDSDEIELPSSKRRRTLRRATAGNHETPTPISRRVTRSSQLGSQKNPPDDVSPAHASSGVTELGEPESTGDEEDALITIPTQRRRQRKTAEDPFVVDDDQVEYISSDEEPPQRTRHEAEAKGANREDAWLAADDEIEYVTSDGEEVPVRSSGRKRAKLRSARRQSRQEQEELEDDLADLRDSDQSEDFERTRRTRGGPVTIQKDKARQHFDLLRRRRAGEKAPRVLDSDEEFDEEDDDAEPVDIENIRHGDRPLGAPHAISDESSVDSGLVEEEPPADEDDFIIEDVVSRRLGLPHPDIPLEFTSYATAKPKDLFIHVVEWLVKNRIAPAFSRNDPIYKLALSKVSDQVAAQAGSRLISSAWNADFKNAILARPTIKTTYLDDLDDGDDGIRTCDACNRTNHPALYDFVLSGEPYKKRDLEPVDDDSEDDEDDDKQDYDEAGHLLPSQNTHFYLGRFCAANAEMGHKLSHWQYHLNQNLLSYLEEQGVLSTEATLARDKMNRKKREREAEAIVDSMDETGVISSLWRDFQSDLDDARLGMEDFEKKGKRGQGRIGTIRSTRNDGLVREWNNDRMTISRGRSESDDDD